MPAVQSVRHVYVRGTLAPEAATAIRNARLRLGWSQAEAAYECHISRRHLQYLESGERRPSDRTAERLIEGLRLSGRAVTLIRANAVTGWGTRHGRPLVSCA